MNGGRCQECGYNKSSVALDFHHRDPTEKRRTVSHLLGVNQPWAWEAAVEEATRCDLLCSNCHREHTYPGSEFLLSEDFVEASDPVATENGEFHKRCAGGSRRNKTRMVAIERAGLLSKHGRKSSESRRDE